MRTADFDIRESDPFEDRIDLILPAREESPYVNRIRLMWQRMRKKIPGQFPAAPGRPSDIDTYLKSVDDIYVTDAYHSLSIEGYRISPELIERVRSGEWNPDGYDDDREHRNALVAGGFPWTVIPLEKRDDYMAALESASVRQDIAPFALFLGRLVSDNLEGKQAPQVPIL